LKHCMTEVHMAVLTHLFIHCNANLHTQTEIGWVSQRNFP